jgi:hypothetical protein
MGLRKRSRHKYIGITVSDKVGQEYFFRKQIAHSRGVILIGSLSFPRTSQHTRGLFAATGWYNLSVAG